MNMKKKMPVGAEPKKVATLVGLLLVAVVVFFMNSSETPEGVSVPPAPVRTVPPPAAVPAEESPIASPSTAARRGRTFQEFRPSLKRKRGEPAPDPMTVDPVLRTDLLTRLQQVNVDGSSRNIFEFGAAPPPKPEPEKLASAKPAVPSPIVDKAVEPPKPAEEVQPAKPQAPPIPLKFYGFVNPSNTPKKRAFFVDGEEIHVVWEGDLVKKRYKVVRIGINSVVVEDTQFGQQQTLPMEAQQT
jgi:hypothetical protein